VEAVLEAILHLIKVRKVDQVQYFLPHHLVVVMVVFMVHLVLVVREDLVGLAVVVGLAVPADQQPVLLVEELTLFLLLLDLEMLADRIQQHQFNHKVAAAVAVQEQ
jgi:hypothetical protein